MGELQQSLYMSTDTREVDDLLRAVSGTMAFDIGANGGFVTAILAEHFDQVIACEPADLPYKALIDYVPDNVTPIHTAVSDSAGFVQFDLRTMSNQRGYLFTGDSLAEWGDVVGHVLSPAVTLLDLARDYGVPDFVKIDTEGHELRIVRGGLEVMRAASWIIEVHDRAQGEVMAQLLDDFRVIRHEGRDPNTNGYLDHYWMTNL